ncbi:MAG: hypothetical protein KAI25_04145, partial [Hyphomicrobiaceae bacterium]|nr:hypothetical protein [Hyphomicrobiaceae bacterium]
MPPKEQPTGIGELTQDQKDRIERFLAAFNAVVEHLRELTNANPNVSVSSLLKAYKQKGHPR